MSKVLPTIGPSAGRSTTKFIAAGTLCLVYALDEDYVIKRRPDNPDDFARQAYNIEIRAYERLGKHHRIAICREVTDEGLVLERGECLRQKLRSLEQGEISIHTRLQWAWEAAEGLRYIHNKDIIHADVGCHNLILDRSGHIKFIDFAGSGIDDQPALVCYEWCSYQPGSTPDVKTDIFAFGSLLFEIESGNVPYHELEETLGPGKLMRRVEHLFSRREYPKVEGLVLRDVITRCWDGDYCSMSDVLKDIDMCCQGISSGKVLSRYSAGCVSM